MRVDILIKEYPPEIYGGAGVHVAELVRALRARDDVDARVHAFGGPRDEDGTTSYPDLAELAGANGALKTLGVDLAIAEALRRDRPGALAHVVRQHGRPPRGPPARRPPRHHRALARADAAVEGRAARRRLRRLVVGRAHRLRGRRHRHRRLGGDARRRAALLPRGRPRPGRRSSTTASTPSSGRPWPTPTGCAATASTRTGRRSCSSAGSPGRRACRCSCARSPSCRRTSRSSCAPGRRTPRRSRPR